MQRPEDTTLDAILENLPVGVIVATPDDQVVMSNTSAQKMLGLTEQQMKAPRDHQNQWYLVDMNSNALPQDKYPGELVKRTRSPLKNYEVGIRRPDNSDTRWVSLNAIPVFSDDNTHQKTIISFANITRRVEVEENLQDTEQNMRALFLSMTEMVCLHDVVFDDTGTPVDYRIIDCNEAYTQITGIAKEDAVGQLASEVYGVSPAPYLDIYARVAISRESHEYTTYFPPMDKHFFISVVSPKKNRFATITTDITDMKHSEEALAAKNKELENYLYIASHDLRSPMVNIQGFSQRLKKQTTAIKLLLEGCELEASTRTSISDLIEKKIPGSLDYIFNSVTKMDKLIHGLLQISRTGRVSMNLEEVDMNALFNRVLSAHNFQIDNSDVKIEMDELVPCFGDQDLLNQVVSNIVDNAIKYRHPDRQLEVKISSEASYNKAVYRIEDNGVGISERHLSRIWDVFFRADDQGGPDGEGIGLSIVKRLVDKHRGKISVSSTEGVGSVFELTLNQNELTLA